MSKIIKMTPEYIEECRRDFETALSSAKLADGKINFTKTFNCGTNKATLYFTAAAWTKMVVLIQEFDKEVAWHGLASRTGGEDANEYTIYDILVYPQEVTGATVNTDQEKYQSWLMDCDDEVFNAIRMQGHSHVNMAPSPSGVDLTHQEKILEQLEDDMFYIFLIWNKSYKRNIKIYDLQKNILFEDADVDVKIVDAGLGLDEFIAQAKELVKSKVYVAPTYAGQVGSVSPYNPLLSATKKEKPKTQIGAGWRGAQNAARDTEDDWYERVYGNNYSVR